MSLKVRLEPAGKSLECQMEISQQKCFKWERQVIRSIFEKDDLGGQMKGALGEAGEERTVQEERTGTGPTLALVVERQDPRPVGTPATTLGSAFGSLGT